MKPALRLEQFVPKEGQAGPWHIPAAVSDPHTPLGPCPSKNPEQASVTEGG